MTLSRVGPALFVVLLPAVLFAIGWWQPKGTAGLLNSLDDWNYSLNRRNPHPDVVFVAVDHKSVKQLGRWPWPREKLAQGLSKLDSAKVVALDMVFSEPTSRVADAALGHSLSRLPAVGGIFLNGPQATTLNADQLSGLMASAVLDVDGGRVPFVESREAEVNIAPVDSALTFSAALNTLADGDELFRHYPAAFVVAGVIVPSLGVQALRLARNEEIQLGEGGREVQLGDKPLPVGAFGFTRLNFYPVDRYHTYSFVDVLNGAVEPATFAGKIVIVGITEAGVTDIRATPLGQFPGPLLHYTFIANLLDDALLHEVRYGLIVPLLLLAALPMVIGTRLQRLRARAVVYAAAATGYLVLTKVLYLHGYWLNAMLPLAALAVSVAFFEYLAFYRTESQSRYLRDAFRSYLAPSLIDELVSHPERLRLGGEVRNATFLFSDVRNFTSLSESLPPSAVVDLLNRYFTPLTAAILEQRGMLDKYIGDAIMAVFNAPLALEDHPQAACRAALEMVRRVDRLNRESGAKGGIEVGIGINTGEALVGNLGSTFRFNYTAIGDAVNAASRLEGLTKGYGAHIIIGEETHRALRGEFVCRHLDRVRVKGKSHAMDVYELMEETPRARALVQAFAAARRLYEQRDYARAVVSFASLADEFNDRVSAHFRERCQNLVLHPPVEEWDGVWSAAK